MCNQAKGDEIVVKSMNAVGLASFSNSIHSPELMVQAREDYMTAIQLTNVALRSPESAKKDSTLFAVMILSIFEIIAGSTQNSMVAWNEHIKGASALVKLRGREQFRTEAGQHLFGQVFSNLVTSCIQRAIPMPAYITELREAITNSVVRASPRWKVSSVITDFTIFRAGVFHFQIKDPRKIVEGALELDRRFIAVTQDAHKVWPYHTVYTEKNPHLVISTMITLNLRHGTRYRHAASCSTA